MERTRKNWADLKRLALMSSAHLRALAFSPRLNAKELPLRSLRWRLYLDILPIEHFGEEDSECQRIWCTAADKERGNYEMLKKQYVVDPDSLAKDGDMDWRKMNPLSLEEDSPWFQYHKDQELRTTIMQDVARTFPDEEYFRQSQVQKIMCDVLFVYAKMHSSLQYRQGMHELLGPLLMVVDNDAIERSSVDKEGDSFCLSAILDNRFIEHDTFAMFDRLMRLCMPWYQSPSYASPPLKPTRKSGSNSGKKAAIDAMKTQTPIIAQCYMMMDKLAAVDPSLAAHLQGLDIEPQLFGIRWYRLLFSREFSHLEDVLVLWDMLFADNITGPLRLVDWIGVVFLLANRRQLLLGDYADNLSTLLHLPPLPKPSQETLEQTPPLPNSPLPPQGNILPGVSDISVLTPKLPYASMTQPSVLPIQRLALQAAYLRSRPSSEIAKLITSQYEIWEEESWDVIEETEVLKQSIADGGRRAVVDTGAVNSNLKRQSVGGAIAIGNNGGHSVASAPISVTWQGRKVYTSNTLQHRRTNGGTSYGGTSPRSPRSISSSPISTAAIGFAGGNQQQPYSTENTSASVISPTESSDGRTPTETVRALGSVTAQVSTIAAQCIDLLAARAEGGGIRPHLDMLGAALHTMSQAWQDEVVRSSALQQGLGVRSPGADSNFGIRPRKMSEADMRAVLRELDQIYVELSKPEH
ncbi:rab-GTPase-TBC domain-containing protein [Coemansia spiralis]|nr:rab-GTPase-TBC domain-containing protein [Coemansia spiralis]